MNTDFNHFFTVITRNVLCINTNLCVPPHLYLWPHYLAKETLLLLSMLKWHFGTRTIFKTTIYAFHICLLIHSNGFWRHCYVTSVFCFWVYHGRKINTVEELKRAIISEWQKLSQRFIDTSINEWRHRLECVVSNDSGHIEHCSLAWVTSFIKLIF